MMDKKVTQGIPMVSDPPITPLIFTDKYTQLVKSQLDRILESKHFRSAKQMQNFLSYVVKKTLSGEGNSLKQFTIAVEALEFPDDFDPNNSPVVRILGGRVRTRLKKYYDQEGKNDEIIIKIPTGSYSPEFTQIEAVKKQSVSKINPEIVDSSGPLLSLACFSDETQSKDINRLLFQLSDNIATKLSHFVFSKLVVSIPFADKSKSEGALKAIKKKYNSDYSLTLFLQELPGNKKNIVYRLIHTHSEEVLWSENYKIESKFEDNELCKVSGKITAAVADIFQGIMQVHWSRGLLKNSDSIPTEFQVLAYYRYYSNHLSRCSFQKAASVCQDILNRNPNDLIANIIFAEFCRRNYVYDYGIVDNSLVRGKQCAEKAIRLKANSHEAHFALAQILFCLNEWEHATEEFSISRGLCKNHTVVEHGTGFHLCLMGKWNNGMTLIKETMELPYYPSWYHFIPFLDFYRRGKYEKALIEAKKISSPGIIHGPLSRCVSYAKLEKLEEAKKELDEVIIRYPLFRKHGKQGLLRFFSSEKYAEMIWETVEKIYKLESD